MRHLRLRTTAILLCLYCAGFAYAQPLQPAAAVPKLVRFSGSFRPADGTFAQSMESVTLAVYRDQAGGNALWHEIQNVVVDGDGHYSLLMGATQNEGMPMDLFISGEPRWLGVQFNRPGEAEQPRVLLVSVPYALKAADAETLGGKPASAYLLAAPTVGSDAAREPTITTLASVKPKATPVNSGQPNYIGKFANTTDLVDSAIYEVNGNVGISTKTPLISLDVRTGALPQMGIAGNTDYLTFFASDAVGPAIYWDPAKDMRFGKGGASLYNPYGFVEQMRIKSSNGNVGIGTQAPVSKLDVVGDVNFTGSVRYQGSPVLQLPGGLTSFNIALGSGALAGNTTGTVNTAIGAQVLQSNTSGGYNTGIGTQTLQSNMTGAQNTATGAAALYLNTTGGENTADGAFALQYNTTGAANTAIGSYSLYANNGDANTATGSQALRYNTTGGQNTATGYETLNVNTTGGENTADGALALQYNTTGSANVASGWAAMNSNTTGGSNTAIGLDALVNNTSGNSNIAIGHAAAIGVNGGNSNNIHIGSGGSSGDNGAIRIGIPGVQSSFFAIGIRGVTTGSNNAIPVLIDGNGQLGTASSSRRFKEDIEDMGAASHDLMRLRPVTFRYKQPFDDGSKPVQYGLIAEEVAEVYPDLVAHSADGQIETVKYQVLDSMLLNELQRQRAEFGAQIHALQERLAKLEAALAASVR